MFLVLFIAALPLLATALPTPCEPDGDQAQPSTIPSQNTTNPCTDHGLTATPNPGHAVVLNHCPYSLNLWSVNPKFAGSALNLVPGGTYTEVLQTFSKNGGGVSLKVSRTTLEAPITQFEYTSDEDDGDLWYNISFVNCADHATMDAAACPGHDGGVKASSGDGCRKLDCTAGEVCEANAYYLPEHGGKANAPVGSCKGEKGVLFELCVGSKREC